MAGTLIIDNEDMDAVVASKSFQLGKHDRAIFRFTWTAAGTAPDGDIVLQYAHDYQRSLDDDAVTWTDVYKSGAQIKPSFSPDGTATARTFAEVLEGIEGRMRWRWDRSAGTSTDQMSAWIEIAQGS